MSRTCEICSVQIPEDFGNDLCYDCYKVVEAENKRLAEQEVKQTEQELKTPPDPQILPNFGILKDDYKENPEMPDKEQWKTNVEMFDRMGVLLYKPTRLMYEFIKNSFISTITSHPQYPKFIWKPKVVDVGCGSGVGSNVLSQEADFVWGIDKNEKSVRFAKEAFTRVKNGIYYNSQVTFDCVDITQDTRDFMKFDVVVAIEIIEHIHDTHKFLSTLVAKFDKGKVQDPTIYYISTPNRNNKSIRDEKPQNIYHVREWTQEEFISLLKGYFSSVEILNAKGEPVGENNQHTPILAKCKV